MAAAHGHLLEWKLLLIFSWSNLPGLQILSALGLAVVGDLPGTIPNIRASNPDRQRLGNTVYVFGYHVTEEVLQSAFSPMGKIVNISMEIEKVINVHETDRCSFPALL